jgi:hypothetical protein
MIKATWAGSLTTPFARPTRYAGTRGSASGPDGTAATRPMGESRGFAIMGERALLFRTVATRSTSTRPGAARWTCGLMSRAVETALYWPRSKRVLRRSATALWS